MRPPWHSALRSRRVRRTARPAAFCPWPKSAPWFIFRFRYSCPGRRSRRPRAIRPYRAPPTCCWTHAGLGPERRFFELQTELRKGRRAAKNCSLRYYKSSSPLRAVITPSASRPLRRFRRCRRARGARRSPQTPRHRDAPPRVRGRAPREGPGARSFRQCRVDAIDR